MFCEGPQVPKPARAFGPEVKLVLLRQNGIHCLQVWGHFGSPCDTKVYKCPWGLEWQKPENIRIIPNLSMVQWPLPALGSGLGLDSSLRPEGDSQQWGDPAAGCEHGPTSAMAFVTGDVTKRGLVFFPCFKNKQNREFVNLWSAQKGEAPDEGVLGTVPTRRGTQCLRGSFSCIGSTLGTPSPAPWGHGSCSPPAAHCSWLLAW